MIRNIFTAALASAAMAIGAPALAGPGHAGGAGGMGANMGAMGGLGRAGMNAGMNGQGSLNASPNSALNRTTTPPTMTTNPAATVSKGPAHASTTGIAHANSRSVLASGQVPAGSLPNLAMGDTVLNANGTTIGTISQVVTDSSGDIRTVIVTNSSTGATYRLSPMTLSISGSTVTTTSTTGG